MGLHIRKSYPPLNCDIDDPITCPPQNSYDPSYLPPDVDVIPSTSSKHIKITSTYLIITFSIVAAAFFVLCCYAIYAKFFSPRRTTSSRQQTQQHQLFLDEEQDHGPEVDHPIWYIRTTGLQQSVIGAITVCNYKKDEGLIEGTECSVCLSEFQEDESLRLLPKCNHAFHLPCIDTWLRSHTNCPMCRAPIVTDPTRVPSMDPSSSFLEIQILESGVDNNNNEEGEEEEEEEEEEEVCQTETHNSASEIVNVTVQPRRSVSLDSSSAAKISLALATVLQGESHGNNSKRVAKGACSSSSTSSIKRSRSFNAKHLLSWYDRSQRKPNPNAPLRSF